MTTPTTPPALPPLPEPATFAYVEGRAMQGAEYRDLSSNYDEFSARYSVKHMNAHYLAGYEAGRAAQSAVPADDPYFGVQDEVCVTRAISVMNDVLTDIEEWEDKALAQAVQESRQDLCAIIEVIRMRADSTYVPGSRPIDGTFAASLSAPAPSAERPQEPLQIPATTAITEPDFDAIWKEVMAVTPASKFAVAFGRAVIAALITAKESLTNLPAAGPESLTQQPGIRQP